MHLLSINLQIFQTNYFILYFSIYSAQINNYFDIIIIMNIKK